MDDAARYEDGHIRDEDTRRVRVLVSGQVQGVFFRATCAHQAEDAGVSGWVRNRSDGRVEAVFEGRPAAVAHMVAWMRHGPPEARVDTVAVSEEPAAEEPPGEAAPGGRSPSRPGIRAGAEPAAGAHGFVVLR